MRIAISSARQAHYRLPANSFVRRGHSVTMYSSMPPSRFKGFVPEIAHRFVPAPVTLFNALTRITPPVSFSEADSTMFDNMAAALMGECDLMLGAASSSLSSGKAVQRRGGTYVLDRACPDIRVQQAMMVDEAKKVGGVFRMHSPWFTERQVAEYEQADAILSPSDYSRKSFPDHLRKKVVLAPLYGRSKVSPRIRKAEGAPFVVGVVGGNPLRKGYLYLLQAWKELSLPNARLKIRSSSDLTMYPVLEKLLADQANVEIIPYVPDIGAFYAECDAFILPSVDDGFGMALFEAIACGVPSIATRNCGASELLVAGRDALLIDAFSVEQIRDSLRLLYESEETRERLAVSGQAAVAQLQVGDAVRLYEDGIDRLLEVARRSEVTA